jgi:chromosome partitioning protein
MGIVVTVMNMKGGVGKTTVAMHLGGIIARYKIDGKTSKVLLVDYDPQFNLSQAFIDAPTYFSLEKQRKTTLAILQDNETDLNPFELQVPGNEQPPKVTDLVHNIYQSTKGSKLDIIPSTLDLMYIALGQSEKRTKPFEERFRKFIIDCREKYDLIFIDCHPAGSILTKTSLQNSDHVLIPVIPQRYAVRGIGLMLQFIQSKKLQTTGPRPHILFNATKRVGVSNEENDIRSNKRFVGLYMNSTLKRYRAFSEPVDGKGFVWHSRKPWSTQALSNLYEVATEFLKRIQT